MLKLVIPKGSLEAQTLRLFEEADLRVRRGSERDYHGTIDDDRIERVSILRPQEIPLYVQDGLFDLGITGQDWIAETGADLEVLTTLTYAKTGTGHGTKVVLAVPNEHPANSAQEIPLERFVGDVRTGLDRIEQRPKREDGHGEDYPGAGFVDPLNHIEHVFFPSVCGLP